MDKSQFTKLEILIGLLITGIAILILAVGMTISGARGYLVDLLAGLFFVSYCIVGR
jgi:hypothetical protein